MRRTAPTVVTAPWILYVAAAVMWRPPSTRALRQRTRYSNATLLFTSERPQECHQPGILSPPPPPGSLGYFTTGQSLCLHLQVGLRINGGRIDRHVAEPCPYRIDVNPGAQ